MGEKTWDLESTIKFRIEELIIEKEYWDNLCINYSEAIMMESDSTFDMLYRIAQNNRDLAMIKIDTLKNKL